MRQIKVIALLIFLLPGCVTQRKCLDKFPPDTVRTVTTIYRDTTINITIKKLAPKLAFGSINAPLIVRYGNTTVKTYVKHDTIYSFFSSIDTTLTLKLDSVIRVTTEQLSVIQTYKEKYVPKWVRDLACFGGFVAGLLILIFILKVKKFFA
jgi:hypothetical protein